MEMRLDPVDCLLLFFSVSCDEVEFYAARLLMQIKFELCSDICVRNINMRTAWCWMVELSINSIKKNSLEFTLVERAAELRTQLYNLRAGLAKLSHK